MTKASTDEAPLGYLADGVTPRKRAKSTAQPTRAPAVDTPAIDSTGAIVDFLTEKREEIDNRMKQLRPLVEEHDRLQAANAALESVDK